MQGCLLVDSHKSTGSGPVRSPVSCPIKKTKNTNQKHPRTSNVTGPEGAGNAVEDPSSDEERDTTDDETDAEATLAPFLGWPGSQHSRISEHKYFANFSASRTVKFLAAAWKTASRVSIRPRNHSSAAIVKTILQTCLVWKSTRWSISPVATRPEVRRGCLAGRKYSPAVKTHLSMPSPRHVLVSANIVWVDRSSHGKWSEIAPSGPVKVVVTNHSLATQRRNWPCQLSYQPS